MIAILFLCDVSWQYEYLGIFYKTRAQQVL